MRTDEGLARRSFRFSTEWQRREAGAALTPEIDRRLRGTQLADGRLVVHSLSGNERNRLFINDNGKTFADRSTLAGVDNVADGRGFAVLDYNRDGRQDIALVNANTPLFNLYRNNTTESGNVVAIRFEGGNKTPRATTHLSPRDGYGAVVLAELGDLTIKREHRCGEGYGAQNSATMLIGIGDHESVERLTVKWPGGSSAVLENVKAGTYVTAREAGDKPFTTTPYLRSGNPQIPARITQTLPTFPLAGTNPGATARLQVFTTTATWCEACIRHLPEIQTLADKLSSENVIFNAIPIDENDDSLKLNAYVKRWKPAYQMMAPLTSDKRAEVTAFLRQHSGTEEPPLPMTVVTDSLGQVLLVTEGLPSVSDIARLEKNEVKNQ